MKGRSARSRDAEEKRADAPSPHVPLWAIVELVDIQLVDLRAGTRWRADGLPDEAPLLNMTTHTTSELVAGAPRLSATIRFCLHSRSNGATQAAEGGEQIEDSDFFLSATYRALYQYPPGYEVDDAECRDFESRNVPFNVYPYWRELAHSTCTRMELPVGHLPLFRMKPPARPVNPVETPTGAVSIPNAKGGAPVSRETVPPKSPRETPRGRRKK
ncbi:MAG: hypothetical protein IT350_12050 [Deltaproteobacteria bacterium]|nr:hypothetical protein [Deltaproteobacteria bacterium]